MAEYVISATVSIVCSTAVGVLCGKTYDYFTDKIKDDELRQLVVRDLNDIKKKQDYHALADLDCSYSALKEGVLWLNLALGKTKEDKKESDAPIKTAALSTKNAFAILKSVLPLPQGSQGSNISPVVKERFRAAKDSFRRAREEATLAFRNKALSIKHRIMACRLRVAARIFESGVEDLEGTVHACLLALEELHSLPAIQDMFKGFLKGGMRPWQNKTERLENIMSVLFINHALFDFSAKCCRDYPNVFTWSRIKLGHRAFHPILHACEIEEKTSTSEEFGKQLSRIIIDKRMPGFFWFFAVNSRGEIILLYDDKITVVYNSGESKDVMFSDESESNVVWRYRRAVAVDSDDNVYVVRYVKTRDENGVNRKIVLYVLDENYNIKHDSILLDFLKEREYSRLEIAVDKNKNIVMITPEDNQVYVYDNTGCLKFKFERHGARWAWEVVISVQNEIMIRSDDRTSVHVYTTEGELKSTIKVPEGHKVCQVAFHHGICKIIIRTRDDTLLCYSETGELEHSVRVLSSGISSHPSGTFAVWRDESITLI